VSREQCVRIIKRIYEKGQDVALPIRKDQEPITMLASEKGYQMQTVYEPVSYDSAEGVFDALYTFYETVEDDPLWGLEKDLEYVS
jgi:hypothetical protein